MTMRVCDRCERNGDVACVSLLKDGGQEMLALVLHANGTVELPEKDEPTLLRLLGFIRETWLETSIALVAVLRGQRPTSMTQERFVETIENGFTKLRHYGTMEGAVREYLRANGMTPAEVAPTQPAGRA